MNIEELHRQRNDLVIQMTDKRAEMAALNSSVKGRRLSQDGYRKLCDRQSEIKSAICQCERQIVDINTQLAQDHADKVKASVSVRHTTESGHAVIAALCELRQEYQLFAADKTRVGSMRQMAAEFVLKLNPIIRGKP